MFIHVINLYKHKYNKQINKLYSRISLFSSYREHYNHFFHDVDSHFIQLYFKCMTN